MITYKNESGKTLVLEHSKTPFSSKQLKDGDEIESTLLYRKYTADGTISIKYIVEGGKTISITRVRKNASGVFQSTTTEYSEGETFFAHGLDYITYSEDEEVVFGGTPEGARELAHIAYADVDANDERFTEMEAYNPVTDPLQSPHMTTLYTYVANGDIGAQYVSGSTGQVKTKRVFYSDAEVGDPVKKYIYYYADSANATKATAVIELPDTVVEDDILA